MRKSLLAVIVLIGCRTAFAQQQHVSITVVKVDSIPTIELSNPHSVPIEAVAITSVHAGREQFPDTITYDVRLNYKYDLLIPPGSTKQIRLPLMDAAELPSPPTPTLRAVIFSDGTAAGEQYWIEHSLNKRKVLVDEIDKVIWLLRSLITQNLTREQSLTALNEAWATRARHYNGVTGEEREASERIFYFASSTLGAQLSINLNEDTSELLSSVIRGLIRWRTEIKDARPVSSKPMEFTETGQSDLQKMSE